MDVNLKKYFEYMLEVFIDLSSPSTQQLFTFKL